MVFATFNDLEIRYYAHLFNFHTYKRGALHIKCTPTIDIEPFFILTTGYPQRKASFWINKTKH
jgi:hypothetical protein